MLIGSQENRNQPRSAYPIQNNRTEVFVCTEGNCGKRLPGDPRTTHERGVLPARLTPFANDE